jgi:hypothetical protein
MQFIIEYVQYISLASPPQSTLANLLCISIFCQGHNILTK